MKLSVPFIFRIEQISANTKFSLRVSFENTSSSGILLNLRNAVGETNQSGQLPTALRDAQLHELEFLVVEEGGKPLDFMVDIKQIALDKSHFGQLQPKGISKETICLSTYFNIQPSKPYNVQCAYMNCESGDRFGVKAWTGLIHSNILHCINW